MVEMGFSAGGFRSASQPAINQRRRACLVGRELGALLLEGTKRYVWLYGGVVEEVRLKKSLSKLQGRGRSWAVGRRRGEARQQAWVVN